MTRYHDLRGPRRRRHRRLLRDVQRSPHGVYIRHESEFRMAERLHRAGLVTACVSKFDWLGGCRPYRELAVFAVEAEALRHYDRLLPR